MDERRPAAPGEERFPILVEKILASGEALPAEWAVDGTTGYEFMTTLEDVFIDAAGYEQLEARHRGRLGTPDFHTVAVDAKRRVLRGALNADVRRIAPMLAAVARRADWPHRTIADYAGAIVELVALLPVYRTCIDAECPDVRDDDRRVLEETFAQLRQRNHADAVATDALERTLLGGWRGAEQYLARARLAFVLRWQQLTGPAAAKGVEDTALYVYAPLASRNEVGGDPGVPVAGAVERLHARLDALSVNPAAWDRRLRRWRRHHRTLQSLVAGRLAPTRATDNFIYQALVGIWPAGSGVRATDDELWLAELTERLTKDIQKAVREAKVSTSWTDPDAGYEAAIETFITGMLLRPQNARFLHDVEQYVASLEPPGRWNALARLVVHLTAPGVPDLYQGDEPFFRALVDPDNRRPVDWEKRRHALDRLGTALAPGADIDPATLAAWCARPEDDTLTLYVTASLLHLRRRRAALVSGAYAPLAADGGKSAPVVAFLRSHGDAAVLVVVPRLTCGVGGPVPIREARGDTAIRLPADVSNSSWRCESGGQVVQSKTGVLPVAGLLSRIPVAVLTPHR